MSTPGDLLGALGREARARLAGRPTDPQARVYRARTVEELIPRIQRELGEDAIVLRRREGLTGGVLGFFQHPWVEIEAIASVPALDVYDEAESVAPPLVSELAEQAQAAAQAAPGAPPGMPFAAPGLPHATPGLPLAAPGMPLAAPGMPQAGYAGNAGQPPGGALPAGTPYGYPPGGAQPFATAPVAQPYLVSEAAGVPAPGFPPAAQPYGAPGGMQPPGPPGAQQYAQPGPPRYGQPAAQPYGPPPAQPYGFPPAAPPYTVQPPAYGAQPIATPPRGAPLYAQQAAEQGGSAYVTPHLAALARANRERLEERALLAQPASPAPLAPRAAPPVAPSPFTPPAAAPGGSIFTAAGSPGATSQAGGAPQRSAAELAGAAGGEVAREGYEPARFDFNELLPETPEQQPELPARGAGAGRAAVERRTVAAGSGDRARAGVEKGLERYGVGGEFAQELIGEARAHVLPLAPRSGLAAAVRTAIAQRVPVAPALPRQGAAIVMVGAGGAGKTTCCATLLAAYRANSTLPAAFATVLREPVHGELQLLLHPLLVRPAPLDSARAVRALRRARGEGLVVIDTPQLSPADRGGIKRLGRMLAELAPERIVVAVPATLGRGAANQLLDALEPLQANAMAVTHAEETDQIGVALEAACRFGLAPEYMLDRGRGGGWRLTRLDPSDLAAMVLR